MIAAIFGKNSLRKNSNCRELKMERERYKGRKCKRAKKKYVEVSENEEGSSQIENEMYKM